MKKKKLVLKTETVRVMQTRELTAVQGGVYYYYSATGCQNCVINANIGGVASQPAGGCPGQINNTPYIDPALGHG